jgi:prefoldin alpha subunit
MNEEELTQAIGALESYKASMQSLEEQKNFVKMSLREYEIAKSTLEAFKNAEKGDEVMVPIGAGILAKMSILDPDSFIVNAGSDISVEKNFEETMKTLEKRMNDIQTGLKSIDDNLNRLNKEYERLAQFVQQAYEEYQRSQNVQNP